LDGKEGYICRNCYERLRRPHKWKTEANANRSLAKLDGKRSSEKLREKNRRFREQNPGYFKRYREEHRAMYARSRNTKEGLYHVLQQYVCGKCGEFDKRLLVFDHIGSDGADDRRRFAHSRDLYRYYTNNPLEAQARLQVLCVKCNWLKRYEVGLFN
jgi:hypothetical protein